MISKTEWQLEFIQEEVIKCRLKKETGFEILISRNRIDLFLFIVYLLISVSVLLQIDSNRKSNIGGDYYEYED